MAELSGELLYLPHHRERPPLRSAERIAHTEEANQETLSGLFNQMVDVAVMPTQFTDKLMVATDFLGDNLEREITTFQLNQRHNIGLAFSECVDSAILAREDGIVTVVEYSRTYFRGVWQKRRKPDELQYNWVQQYQDGTFNVVDAVLTEGIAAFHFEEAAQEIDRRAKEQRMRYMMGVVAIARPPE